jgi:hypothetical protein
MTLLTEKPQAGPDLPAAPIVPLDRAANAVLGLAVVAALVAIFFVCMVPIAATDFFWQAKTGEIIVRTGGIPTRDLFSWTSVGQPWLVHEWLTEVFFYFALANRPQHPAAMEGLLIFYKAGLAVLACALVMVRSWRRTGSIVLAIGAALAAAYLVRNFADLRPQMVTFVLLAGLLLALDEYRDGNWRRLPWALPAVFALWANLHGGVVVGLLLLVLWVAGDAVGGWLFRRPVPGCKELALGVGASCLAVALNPNGFHVYAYPFQVLGHPAVMDYISEWFSPNFHHVDLRAFAYLMLATLGVLAVARPVDGPRYGEILVLLAMAYAALTAQRNTAPFGIAAAPVLAAGLAALWRSAEPLEKLRNLGREPAGRFLGAVCLVVALCVLIQDRLPRNADRRLVPVSRWYEWGARLEVFPRAAAELMADGMWSGRMYNDYIWGGYLIWRLYPENPVFIDGRAEVYYPTKTFEDEMVIHRVQEGWLEALDRRGVEVILTNRSGYLAQALRWQPRWKLAFTGTAEVVYVRAQPLPAEE